MQKETAQKLLDINRQFYQTFAGEFDATRQRVQPGVGRVLDSIPKDGRILDLGCGNGEVARELERRGFEGEYVGVDFSEGLIEAARKGNRDRESRIENRESGRGNQEKGLGKLVFRVADLTAEDWDSDLEGPFDVVLAFAVLHHLPGVFHEGILRKVRGLLPYPYPSTASFTFSKSKMKPSAQDTFPLPCFIFSNWQFLNSPRWQARIQPWERVGLTTTDVDDNDYLLDWRRGGEGLRYVHHFSEEELISLAQAVGFEIEETSYSDGKEGDLGMYQIWKVAE